MDVVFSHEPISSEPNSVKQGSGDEVKIDDEGRPDRSGMLEVRQDSESHSCDYREYGRRQRYMGSERRVCGYQHQDGDLQSSEGGDGALALVRLLPRPCRCGDVPA